MYHSQKESPRNDDQIEGVKQNTNFASTSQQISTQLKDK